MTFTQSELRVECEVMLSGLRRVQAELPGGASVALKMWVLRMVDHIGVCARACGDTAAPEADGGVPGLAEPVAQDLCGLAGALWALAEEIEDDVASPKAATLAMKELAQEAIDMADRYGEVQATLRGTVGQFWRDFLSPTGAALN